MPGSSRSETPSSSSEPSARTSSTLDGNGTGDSQSTAAAASSSQAGNQDGHGQNGSLGTGVGSFGTVNRKRRQRDSGGFLLSELSTYRHSSLPGGKHGSLKGKEKAVSRNGDLGSSSRGRGHRLAQSIGSSPLAGKVLAAGSAEGEETRNNGQDGRSQDGEDSFSQSTGPRVSQHTGTSPAQLINLAMQLSESRRRQASGRYGLLEPGLNQRVVSGGSPRPRHSSAFPLSPRIPSQSRRQVSRDSLFRASNGPSARLDPGQNTSLGSSQQSQQSQPGCLDELVVPFEPSPATLIRAERAKIALELAYEHRRLLRYLSKYPTAAAPRPRSARSSVSAESDEGPGRQYNPLQYIRNRKTRFRQRCPLNAEADGWKDVDRVRGWVSDVAAQRGDQTSSVDDDFVLPQFPGGKEDGLESSAGNDMDENPTSGQANSTKPASKRSLPRVDWMTTSWNMLADAYWVNQDNNKGLIEDHYDNKLFPKVAKEFDSGKRASVVVDHRRPSSTPRTSLEVPGVRASRELQRAVAERKSLENTRRGHKSHASITSLIGPSEGQRHRWTNRILRRHSSSSSDSSRHDPLGVTDMLSGQSGPDRQITALLDRQIREFISSQPDDPNWRLDNPEPGSPRSPARGRSNSLYSDAFPSPIKRRPSELKPMPLPLQRTTGRRWEKDAFSDLDSTAPNSPVNSSAGPRASLDIPGKQSGRERSTSTTSRLTRIVSEDARSPKHKAKGVEFRSATHSTSSTTDFENVRNVTNGDAHMNGHGKTFPISGNASSHDLTRQRTENLFEKVNKGYDETTLRLKDAWRGRRLADRVGGFLRRRDAHSADAFERDSRLGGQLRSQLSQGDTNNSSMVTISRTTTGKSLVENPRYKRPDLPVFTSPFQHRDASVGAKRADTNKNKLGPPLRLDMASISRGPSPMRRTGSNESAEAEGAADQERRESEMSIKSPRRGAVVDEGTGHMPAARGVNASPWPAGPWESPDEQRVWRGPELGLSSPRNKDARTNMTATRKDVVRVEALLVATQIKAANMVRYMNAGPSRPHHLLTELRSSGEHQTLAPAPSRTEEHTIVASMLLASIRTCQTHVRDAGQHFTDTTMEGLHAQLDALKSRISSTLTALVLTSADSADDLGAMLNASYTLEVRRLNDALDALVRQRRRRFRWLRRGGWALLEWTLLSLMWCVWFVVVIFKSVRAVFRFVLAAVRWLLWL